MYVPILHRLWDIARYWSKIHSLYRAHKRDQQTDTGRSCYSICSRIFIERERAIAEKRWNRCAVQCVLVGRAISGPGCYQWEHNQFVSLTGTRALSWCTVAAVCGRQVPCWTKCLSLSLTAGFNPFSISSRQRAEKHWQEALHRST